MFTIEIKDTGVRSGKGQALGMSKKPLKGLSDSLASPFKVSASPTAVVDGGR